MIRVLSAEVRIECDTQDEWDRFIAGSQEMPVGVTVLEVDDVNYVFRVAVDQDFTPYY